MFAKCNDSQTCFEDLIRAGRKDRCNNHACFTGKVGDRKFSVSVGISPSLFAEKLFAGVGFEPTIALTAEGGGKEGPLLPQG